MLSKPWALSRKRREELLLAVFLLTPAAVTMALVTVYPLVRAFIISLRSWNLMRPDGNPFVGLANYQAVLTDPTFWDSARVTVIFVALAVSLQVVLGLMIALMLNRPFTGRRWVRMLALLPWAVPPVVNGIMWKWILNPSYGAMNGLLYDLGVFQSARDYIIWLGDPALALLMVVMADVWKETPFIILIFLAALQTVHEELYEAAKVDGATRLTVLLRITIPLIRPTIFIALALRTIWALKSFDLIYALTAGGPSGATSVLGYYTYVKSFVSLDLGRGAAVAYIMTGVVFVLVLIYQRVLYREVEY
jgi:ABC-type sugar transport system permease subunit